MWAKGATPQMEEEPNLSFSLLAHRTEIPCVLIDNKLQPAQFPPTHTKVTNMQSGFAFWHVTEKKNTASETCCLFVSLYVHTCLYVCMYVCMYVCTYVRTYVPYMLADRSPH